LSFAVKSMKTEQAKDDPELCRFYEMFKDKKYIGSAKLSREVLLSEEWSKIKQERKQTLTKMLDNNFISSLKSQVESEVTTPDVKPSAEQIVKSISDIEN